MRSLGMKIGRTALNDGRKSESFHELVESMLTSSFFFLRLKHERWERSNGVQLG